MKLGLYIVGALVWVGCSSTTPPAPTTPPRPEFRVGSLLALTDISGSMRSCGCSPELERGGFDRLAPVIAQRKKALGNPPVIHAGPLFYGRGALAPERAAQWDVQPQLIASLAQAAGVDVAGVAALDLLRGTRALRELGRNSKITLLSANVSGFRRFRLYQHGALLFGVVGVTAKPPSGSKARWTEPERPLGQAVKDLHDRGVDTIVLLSDLGLEATRKLAKTVAGIDFALVGGQPAEDEVPANLAQRSGDSHLLHLEREARTLGQLTVRLAPGNSKGVTDASPPSPTDLETLRLRTLRAARTAAAWAAEPENEERAEAARLVGKLLADQATQIGLRMRHAPRVSHFELTSRAIDWDLPQDPAILVKMKAFDARLAQINCSAAGSPPPKPQAGQAHYVGAERCIECHDRAAPTWQKSRHAQAWATLAKGGKTCDRECVACHLTGFRNPGGAFLGHTSGRENVQCESCHGPGSLHAERANGGSGPALFEAPFVRAPGPSECETCHNRKHDPDFDFLAMRPQILGPGHDRIQRSKGK